MAPRAAQAQATFSPGLEFQKEIAIGFAVAPVPLNLIGRDSRLVGLGSYLVNILQCSDCHTNPPWTTGHDPFLGQPAQINGASYLGGGQNFGNGIFSRNLTPENGKPAGLTFVQFQAAMQQGTDFDHPGQLLQDMPWPYFKNLTDLDMVAMYTYLSVIPSVTASQTAATP